MRIAQAAQSPLIVTVGDEKLSVPLFTLDDFIAWGRLEDAERAEVATSGFQPFERVQLLSFYNPLPSSLEDLRQRVRSPRGVRQIPLTCLSRASVVERDGSPLEKPEPIAKGRADEIVKSASHASLDALAVALADTVDQQQTPPTGNASKSGENPLPETQTSEPAS